MLLIFFSEKQAEPAYVSAKICKNIEVLLTRASQRKVRTLKAALPFRKKRLDSCDSIQ